MARAGDEANTTPRAGIPALEPGTAKTWREAGVGIDADGGFAEPRRQHHARPALAHAHLATWRNCLALGDGPARVGQPLQAGVFEVMFLHYHAQSRCPPGQRAAEWLTELVAVGREPVDGTVVQVGRIPVSGSLSRVWLLL